MNIKNTIIQIIQTLQVQNSLQNSFIYYLCQGGYVFNDICLCEYFGCEVAQAEIRTSNLPTANQALYHTATTAPYTAHRWGKSYSNNFAGSAALAEVCIPLSAILIICLIFILSAEHYVVPGTCMDDMFIEAEDQNTSLHSIVHCTHV